MNEANQEQREQFRQENSRRVRTWIEDKLYDLADDIGRGYNQLHKLADAEVESYARGMRQALESLAEREGCGDIPAFVQIHGALGERWQRADLAAGSGRHALKRKLFDRLIEQIRNKRIAMVDQFESFAYATEFRPLQRRVWAIERKGVEREEWDEFQIVQRELRALWELSHRLVGSRYWLNENWKRRTEGRGMDGKGMLAVDSSAEHSSALSESGVAA